MIISLLLRAIFPIRCTCGNCNMDLLQNVYECKCCREIEQCVKTLSSNLVVQDIGTPALCITLHPGFPPVCLEKWSLRLTAGKYKTKANRDIIKLVQKKRK